MLKSPSGGGREVKAGRGSKLKAGGRPTDDGHVGHSSTAVVRIAADGYGADVSREDSVRSARGRLSQPRERGLLS